MMIRYLSSGFFALLAAIVLLRLPAGMNDPLAALSANPESYPFSFVIETPSDPFVLPTQTGNHLQQTEFERNKLPVTEMRCSFSSSEAFHNIPKQLSHPLLKVFRVEPLFLFSRILRL
jgi:ABC-type sugar transport system substrate-binding protein